MSSSSSPLQALTFVRLSRLFLCIALCIGTFALSPKVLLAQTDPSLTITINNEPADVDPPAQLRKGAVLVPLRGVLEKLGATVNYNASKQQIVVQQGGRTFLLGINIPTATLSQIEIPLSAAPVTFDGRAFVPLRSLAELFGYEVQWQGATKTVQINSVIPINHIAALEKMGHFGVTIDTTDIASEKEITALLDAARDAKAAFIKIRFDWSVLEPTYGAPFAWNMFDALVRGAATRGMGVVGVLGNTAQWASIYQETTDVDQWRNAPPQEKYFPEWDNYVRRVVGRYRKEVHAWQIWEYPASYNFRSGSRDYRIVVRRGIVMAGLADPGAVVFAGEPGGVNLAFLRSLKDNGITAIARGVMLHPVSQWQPGVPADASNFLLPYSTLREKNQLYWADALGWPVLSQHSEENRLINSDERALQERLMTTFTPLSQAQYLVKSMTLALAAGMPKAIWGALRDDATYAKVDPVNPDTNSGLIAHDLTRRPSYDAFANLNTLLAKATFTGYLSRGPQAVVLVFSDGTQHSAVAWALDQHKPVLQIQETAPTPEGETAIAANMETNAKDDVKSDELLLRTTPKSTFLDVTGKPLPKVDALTLSNSPVWITHLDPAFVAQLKATNNVPLKTLASSTKDEFKDGVSASFSATEPVENGLYWKKYANFRGEAQPWSRGTEISGLMTTVSRDIYNPAAGNPSIYLDVDDDYLYNEPGIPVKVAVTLYRPRSTGTGAFRSKGGFNIQYDSPEGTLHTPWIEVEQGEGLITYEATLPRAAFSNRDGYDLVINTWGSTQDLLFRSVTVQRADSDAVSVKAETPAPAVQAAP